MASTKEYLDFVLDQLSELDNITYKQMMGEYIMYYNGKNFGGIYDDRFLIKPVKSAISMIENAIYEKPYDGAKEMLLVDNLENKQWLKILIENMYDELMLSTKTSSEGEIKKDTTKIRFKMGE